MNKENLSRRDFIRSTSVMAAGVTAGALTGNGCSTFKSTGKQANSSEICCYNPKKDGGCAVSFGYDVDMPGGKEYLYDRSIPWLGGCNGHLTDDIRNYIRTMVSVAENYDSKLQFFVQGNTFEKSVDVDLFKEISERGHAIDSHMYNHNVIIRLPIENLKSQLIMTKKLIETELKTTNIGMRGPGGILKGLHGYEDHQKAILENGIKWVSTQASGRKRNEYSEQRLFEMVADIQPFYYDTGLLEIPFSVHQDRSFFDVDMGGSPRPLDEWIAHLKQCIDFAYNRNLFLSLTVHPSTSFKHDPDARYLKEILSYCRQRPEIQICTFRDIYRWIDNDRKKA